MRRRLLTTVLLWAFILGALLLGGVPAGKTLLLIFALGAFVEAAGLLRKTGIKLNLPAGLIALALLLGGGLFGFGSLGASAAVLLIFATHWRAESRTMLAAFATLALLGAGFGSLAAIGTSGNTNALWQAVWVIATIKFSDGGAYLIGSKLGSKILWPLLSPKKTRGGFCGALLSGFALGLMGMPLFYPLWVGPVLGILLAAVGSMGDLLESALKRAANMKDSGKVFPGIGGVLDLCDSLILASPVAWVVIRYCTQ